MTEYRWTTPLTAGHEGLGPPKSHRIRKIAEIADPATGISWVAVSRLNSAAPPYLIARDDWNSLAEADPPPPLEARHDP